MVTAEEYEHAVHKLGEAWLECNAQGAKSHGAITSHAKHVVTTG